MSAPSHHMTVPFVWLTPNEADSSGGQLSRKAKATLLSSHAEGPRTAAGDTSFTGQAKAVDTAVESQPAASPRTQPVGSNVTAQTTTRL